MLGFDWDPVHAGVRWRVGGERVPGQEQPEAFREWDVWASWRLPWERHESSGWGVDTRLLTSAGLMKGAESTALVVSELPVLTLGDRGGRFNVDLGVGVAVLSQHRFDRQDFGGHLQGALTFGVSVSPFRHAGIGYRFMHYSDGAAYGSAPDAVAAMSPWFRGNDGAAYGNCTMASWTNSERSLSQKRPPSTKKLASSNRSPPIA